MREQIQRLNKTPSTEVQQGVLATGITQTNNMPFVQQVQKKSKGAELAKTLGMVAEGASKASELYEGQKDEEAALQFAEDKFTYLEELNSLHSNADKVQWMNNKTKELSEGNASERYRELFLNNFDGFYNSFLKGQQEEGYQALEGQLYKDLQEAIVTGKTYEEVTSKYNANLPKDRYHKVYSASILGQASFELAAVETDEDFLKFNEKFDNIKSTYNNNPYAGGNSSQAGQTVNTNFKNSFNGLIATKKAALKTKWTETMTNMETTLPGYSTVTTHLAKGIKFGHISNTKANTVATKEIRKYVERDTKASIASLKNLDPKKRPETFEKEIYDIRKKVRANLKQQVKLKMITNDQAEEKWIEQVAYVKKVTEQASLTLDMEDGTFAPDITISEENRDWYKEEVTQHLVKSFTEPFNDFVGDDINNIRTKYPTVYKKGLDTFVGQAVRNLNEENYEQSKMAILDLNQKTANNVLNNVSTDQRDSIVLMNLLPSYATFVAARDKKNSTSFDYKKESIPKEYQDRYNDILESALPGERTNLDMRIKALLYATDKVNPEAIFESFEASNKKITTENIQYNENIYSNFRGPSFTDKDGVPKTEYIGRAIESVLKEKNLDLDDKNKYSLRVQDNKLYIYSYGTNILKVGGYDIEDKLKQYNREALQKVIADANDNSTFQSLAPATEVVEKVGSGLGKSFSILGSKAVDAVLDSGPIDFIQKTFDIRVNDEKTYKED